MTQMICIFHDMLVRNAVPLLKARLGETPQDPSGESRGPTASGKQAPEVEINVQYVKAKKTVDKLERKFVYSS
ncbi:hypothetical protein [Peribacillus frigoritolerans]|uniref:hypothetical protein n=1 Tax=Peribacillus frigoritolerans TaxID=450367 RepID=UPI0039A2450A